jgi:septum formation protein
VPPPPNDGPGPSPAAGQHPPPLVLASASPRRRALLEAFGVELTVVPAEIDEHPRPGEAAADLVARLAVEKAAAVAATFTAAYVRPPDPDKVVRLDDVRRSHRMPVVPVDDVPRGAPGTTPLPARAEVLVEHRPQGAVVVAADTVVVLDGEILNKPRDVAVAQRMLRSLSDRSHEVMTAIAIEVVDTERTTFADVAVDTAEVRFGPLTKEDVLWYLASREPMDKAGAYGIQGLGALFITGIVGNHQTVVGLALPVLNDLLHRAGYDLRHWQVEGDRPPLIPRR